MTTGCSTSPTPTFGVLEPGELSLGVCLQSSSSPHQRVCSEVTQGGCAGALTPGRGEAHASASSFVKSALFPAASLLARPPADPLSFTSCSVSENSECLQPSRTRSNKMSPLLPRMEEQANSQREESSNYIQCKSHVSRGLFFPNRITSPVSL